MKALLALVTLVLTALLLEERAREVAGDAQQAYGELASQVSDAKKNLTGKIEEQPLLSVLVAAGVAFALASIVPSGD